MSQSDLFTSAHPRLAENVTAGPEDLRSYDWIVCSTSAGKDSQVTLDITCQLAKKAGVLDRVVAVHCDLGRVEWPGTRELAKLHAKAYGPVRFEVYTRKQGDLLTQIEHVGSWPRADMRYCTSDHKRAQVYRSFTQFAGETREALVGTREHGRQVRILNVMGFRAEESPARAKRRPFTFDPGASNGRRHVDVWLPIHEWKATAVWSHIRASGVPYHHAYDLGMPRLSCAFCIFAPKAALVVAGRANPELLDTYVKLEERIGQNFRKGFSLKVVQAEVNAGEPCAPVDDWKM